MVMSCFLADADAPPSPLTRVWCSCGVFTNRSTWPPGGFTIPPVVASGRPWRCLRDGPVVEPGVLQHMPIRDRSDAIYRGDIHPVDSSGIDLVEPH